MLGLYLAWASERPCISTSFSPVQAVPWTLTQADTDFHQNRAGCVWTSQRKSTAGSRRVILADRVPYMSMDSLKNHLIFSGPYLHPLRHGLYPYSHIKCHKRAFKRNHWPSLPQYGIQISSIGSPLPLFFCSCWLMMDICSNFIPTNFGHVRTLYRVTRFMGMALDRNEMKAEKKTLIRVRDALVIHGWHNHTSKRDEMKHEQGILLPCILYSVCWIGIHQSNKHCVK